MPLASEALPLPTPLDPNEEPPGSIDPLGTLAAAERLADALLPGFTARMWRARLLTFSTVSTSVADHVVRLLGGREETRLEARLIFERMFVAAIALAEQREDDFGSASRRLPGIDLARRALSAGEPLTHNNFL